MINKKSHCILGAVVFLYVGKIRVIIFCGYSFARV
jgi:hypothetical protein